MTRLRCVVAAIALLVVASIQAAPSLAQTLTGTVSSAAEGAMEGVLVSAQEAGSPITVTVVSDAQGRFRFPDGDCRPGTIRCAFAPPATISTARKPSNSAPAPADVAIKLRKTADLAAQLTNTEWFMSMPGTAEQKRPLIECMSCHTLRADRALDITMPNSSCRCSSAWRNYANNTTPGAGADRASRARQRQ